MQWKYERTRFLLASLTVALVAGCGGGDGPSVANDGDDNNATNNGTNNGPNNDNNSNNGTSNNDGGSNNGTSNDDNNGSGAATFLQPADDVVHTSGEVVIEVQLTGEAQDAELLLDGSEVLSPLEHATPFTWDTTSRVEGTYELSVRYTVGGDTEVGTDVRRVVVDRTSPTVVDAAPEARSDAGSRDDIFVAVDEALDPSTVNPATVMLELSDGKTPAYTTSLSSDGTTISIDFDRTSVALPYEAVVRVDGVADLAGNSILIDWAYNVPAWRSEELPQMIDDAHYFQVAGSEYIIGRREGSPQDILDIRKGDGAGGWTSVLTDQLSQIYDVAATTESDLIYIAVLRRSVAGDILPKSAELFEFDPSDDSLTSVGSVVVSPDSTGGAIAVDVRSSANQTFGVVATVSNKQLRVFEFVNGGISQSQNTFPSVSVAEVRDESLAVHLRADYTPEVFLARCANAMEPCVRTTLDRYQKNGGTWSVTGTTNTPISPGISNDCDEFQNFSVAWEMDVATMVLGYHAPCNAPVPNARLLSGPSALDPFYDGPRIYDSMPAPDSDAYWTYVAIDSQGTRYMLSASTKRLLLAEFLTSDTMQWHFPIGEELNAQGTVPLNSFHYARLFMADDSPIVLARYAQRTLIWRMN